MMTTRSLPGQALLRCTITLACLPLVLATLAGTSVQAEETVLQFGGTNRVIITETPALQQNFTGLTVEYWMKPSKVFSDYGLVVFRNVTNTTVGASLIYAGINDVGKIAVTINAVHPSASYLNGATTVTPAANEWCHVAGTWDGATGHVYVNGGLVHTYTAYPMTANTVKANSTALGAGAMTNSTSYRAFSGLLSDVRIWNVKRSQSEINACKDQRLVGNETGLIAYWPLNDGSGNTTTNITDGAAFGTIANPVWTTDATLTLGPPGDYRFDVANPVTGSSLYLNSGSAAVTYFPVWDDYDRYQVTATDSEPGETGWLAYEPGTPPATVTFAPPGGDGPVTLYLWFKDSNGVEPIQKITSDAMIFTTAMPVPVAKATMSAYLVPGAQTAFGGVGTPASDRNVDGGSTGGEYGGQPLAIHSSWVNWVSGPSPDRTPDDPVVTLDTTGEYTLSLSVMNEAGNVAVSPSTVTVTLTASASTNTWVGGTDWFDPANWTHGVPSEGQAVRITNGTPRISGPSAALASLTMTGGTLTFTNWMTSLNATDIHISNATVNCAGPFHENAMSNRVWLVCSNLTLATNGNINLNSRGYAGLDENYGQGPGGGSGQRIGASHGGYGGNYTSKPTYDSAQFPELPGSSGGGYRSGSTTRTGGHGGGAVRIDATGAVIVNGTISANGGDSASGHAAGGSGGAISIACRTFSGTAGVLNAAGGTSVSYGGGGGGCISVRYDTSAQSELSVVPDVTYSVARGGGGSGLAYMGTVWFPDAQLIASGVLRHTGRIVIPESWSVASLTITNNSLIAFEGDGMQINVTGNVLITGSGGILELGGDGFFTTDLLRTGIGGRARYSTMSAGVSLIVGGNLTITNGAALHMYAADAEGRDHGGLLDVGGSFSVASGSTARVLSHPISGGSPLITAASLTVAKGASFTADNGGFIPGSTTISDNNGYGPGANMADQNGAGYGGHGGFNTRSLLGSMPYGAAADPRYPGSAGGNRASSVRGTGGGGLIRIEATGTVRVDGTMSASCTATPGSNAGAGSGGGINIGCQVFASDGGILRARGGINNGTGSGAGGGGRIAIRYNALAQAAAPRPVFSELDVRPGANNSALAGDLGTIYFTDSTLLRETISSIWGQVILGTPSFTLPSLAVSNASIRFANEGGTMTVAGNLTVGADGEVEIGGGTLLTNGSFRITAQNFWHRFSGASVALACGGNLTLTNGGNLAIYAGPTNTPLQYGGRLDVSGHLVVASNSWLAPVSHPTNGGSVFMTAGQVTVLEGGSITASARGYAGAPYTVSYNGFGPGYGGRNNGGGYGGLGQLISSAYQRGQIYGIADMPVQCGSGGGRTNSNAGVGGGLVWLQTDGTFLLDGLVSANGLNYNSGQGCGSGGGVLLDCRVLTGKGAISANGGINTAGASGGGGRVAIWYGWKTASVRQQLYAGNRSIGSMAYTDNCPTFEGTAEALGGYSGGDGSVTYVGFSGAPGTVFSIR